MSTHNICFRREIKKNIMWMPPLICSYDCTDAQANLSLCWELIRRYVFSYCNSFILKFLLCKPTLFKYKAVNA